jgi:hypothetical protein
MTFSFITGSLLIVALFSILCRLLRMKWHRTQHVVVVQHLVLGFSLVLGLFLPLLMAKAAMSVGICLFLLSGAYRWRYAAPADTDAAPLDEVHR